MSKGYTNSFKETMASKMSGPGARSAGSLSAEIGISQSTLSRWLRQYGSTAGGTMSNKRRPGKRSAEEKLQAVQEYDSQPDDGARGRLLRSRGLYSVEIERWRAEMLAALKSTSNRNDPKDKRIKELEQNCGGRKRHWPRLRHC